jgi:hypothetical protein
MPRALQRRSSVSLTALITSAAVGFGVLMYTGFGAIAR